MRISRLKKGKEKDNHFERKVGSAQERRRMAARDPTRGEVEQIQKTTRKNDRKRSENDRKTIGEQNGKIFPHAH